jgi:hypothetical protein
LTLATGPVLTQSRRWWWSSADTTVAVAVEAASLERLDLVVTLVLASPVVEEQGKG